MQYIGYFIIPFGISLVLTPLVRALALRKRFVAYPRADRWHKQPTALLGGIGIYLASIIPALFIQIPDKRILSLLIGASFLFFVGLADDKFHFTPYVKLFTQIIAGCLAIFFGISINFPNYSILSIPVTLLWIILVTNSFNLLDNIDGLAGGIAGISAFMLFISSFGVINHAATGGVGLAGTGVYGLILAGAVFGFLPYNFNPAKIFMGDSGSMFLGYSLAVISIVETNRHIASLATIMFIPVLILSVPIFDTIFVTILRLTRGKKIFEGGKDHTSHRLVALGLSQRKTVLLLYFVSIVFGLIALLSPRLNMFIVLTIAILGVIILLLFAFFLSDSTLQKESFNNKDKLKLENKTVLSSMFMHKRRITEVILDFIMICVAYSMAYFLRFENQLLSSNLNLLKESLVWIILIKMSVFFISGLYRGAWKYISISDLFTMLKVVTLGSIISILFLTFVFRFKEYSRAVFFIDWLILLFLVTGSRLSFRILGEFFGRIGEKGADNILIFGAGDAGEAVIREIKRNKSLNYNPIGFIDDDPAKSGNRIQGVSVLGSRSNIKNLVKKKGIKEIIVAVPSLGVEDFSEIVKICKECGVSYKRVKGILDHSSAN